MTASNVVYVLSRFPKTTETFIVREMEAVAALGIDVGVVSLVRERNEIVQPGVEAFLPGFRAVSDLSILDMGAAQVTSFLASPRRWARMWLRALIGNRRSKKFLLRGVVAAAGAPALARMVEQRGAERLHAHWGTHAALLAYLLHILTDVPYSVTLHAHDLHTDRTMLDEKLTHAAAVITISDHNLALIGSLYPELLERSHVVRCGVDTSSIPVVARALSPVPRVVCVAGLRDFKGHRYLLDAVAELRGDGRDVQLELVGDGPLRTELENQAAELSIRDSIVFHGALKVDRAVEIVGDADVAVMPSIVLANGRRDGIPVALIEAMASGTPVVASDVSGIPELVRRGVTGLLVPECDPTALATAIAQVLDEPERTDERVAAARALVEREYDIRRSAAKMVEIWSDRDVKTSPLEGVQLRRPLLTRVVAIGAVGLFAGLLAMWWGTSQPDEFRSTVVVAFAPSADLILDADIIDVIANLDKGALPATAAGIATSGSAKDEATLRIGLADGSGDYSVDAAPVPEATLLDIVVRGPDASITVDLANALGEVVGERVRELYSVYDVETVTSAGSAKGTDRRVVLVTFAGALFGTAVAAAVVVAADRGTRRRDDVIAS